MGHPGGDSFVAAGLGDKIVVAVGVVSLWSPDVVAGDSGETASQGVGDTCDAS